MSQPGNIPVLAAPDVAAADPAELSRCLEHAAEITQAFAGESAPSLLDALLAAGAEGLGGPGNPRAAQETARIATAQAATLLDEVERFLATTRTR
ncbi:MAG TPA: hypothetical protein VLL72_00615 [Kiloniellales bacterium]|nr:hypothetical protein [Kiloniellales bacterium]